MRLRQSQAQRPSKPCSAVKYFFFSLDVPALVRDVGSGQIDYDIEVGVRREVNAVVYRVVVERR